MNRVAGNQRAGVSALNFFVMSVSQAASAGLAGVAVTRYGYPPVLALAAAAAAAAALLFRLLLAEGEDAGVGIAAKGTSQSRRSSKCRA
jgi:predicted MFS family arabinose efflux permease